MGIREAGLDERTTLTRVQPHRLRALILEDLERFPGSGRGDIHRRIGPEIHTKTLARPLEALLKDGQIVASGERRWRTYRLGPAKRTPRERRGRGERMGGGLQPESPSFLKDTIPTMSLRQ